MEEIWYIAVAIVLIVLIYYVLKSLVIWLYRTFKYVGRLAVGIVGSVLTQLVTKELFGIGIDNFSPVSIGTALVIAFLFPNAGANDEGVVFWFVKIIQPK